MNRLGSANADFTFIDDDGREIDRWVSHEGTWIKRGADAGSSLVRFVSQESKQRRNNNAAYEAPSLLPVAFTSAI